MWLTPEGARGDGSADDTGPLAAMLAEMQSRNVPGFLNGRYLVREGALKWLLSGKEHAPGPVLFTMPGTTLIGAGVADAPLLTVKSLTPWRYVTGGSIGPLTFKGTLGKIAPQQHGLMLAGVQHMQFGRLHGNFIGGDVVHAENVTTDNFGGDQCHVFGCSFDCIESERCGGWALNNDTPNQTFNGNRIGVLRAVLSGKGGWRGSGAGNICRVISIGMCRGWALDFRVNHGAPARTLIIAAEIDSPEYGVRVSGNLLLKILGMRINHRFREAPGTENEVKAWPKTAIQLGESDADRKLPGMASLVMNASIDVTHRLGPHARPLTPDTMGTLLDLSNDDGVCDVFVKMQIMDGHFPRLPIVPVVNASKNAWGIHVMRDDRTVFDTRRK